MIQHATCRAYRFSKIVKISSPYQWDLLFHHLWNNISWSSLWVPEITTIQFRYIGFKTNYFSSHSAHTINEFNTLCVLLILETKFRTFHILLVLNPTCSSYYTWIIIVRTSKNVEYRLKKFTNQSQRILYYVIVYSCSFGLQNDNKDLHKHQEDNLFFGIWKGYAMELQKARKARNYPTANKSKE